MTEPAPEREVSLTLRFQAISAYPDGLSVVACLKCLKPLDIHQPDADLPDRMLATCPGCQSWYLIGGDPSSGQVVMVLLPDFTLFHNNALGSRKPGSMPDAPTP